MKVLAIDSSSVVAGVAILDGEQLVYEAYHHHKRNHSEILMPLIEEALLSCEMHPQDLDLFAVAGGPGSFTGLRIGVSIIKGLAQALERPVVSVPTLDALAWNIVGMEGLICPIMDASVGETEQTAAAKGIEYEVAKLPMMYSGRYMAENEGGDGICKILIEKNQRTLLGVHMIGNYSSEIIYGAALMIEMEMRVDDVKELVFPHPTVSEIIRETIFEF
jgi:hypothetical protein